MYMKLLEEEKFEELVGKGVARYLREIVKKEPKLWQAILNELERNRGQLNGRAIVNILIELAYLWKSKNDKYEILNSVKDSIKLEEIYRNSKPVFYFWGD